MPRRNARQWGARFRCRRRLSDRHPGINSRATDRKSAQADCTGECTILFRSGVRLYAATTTGARGQSRRYFIVLSQDFNPGWASQPRPHSPHPGATRHPSPLRRRGMHLSGFLHDSGPLPAHQGEGSRKAAGEGCSRVRVVPSGGSRFVLHSAKRQPAPGIPGAGWPINYG